MRMKKKAAASGGFQSGHRNRRQTAGHSSAHVPANARPSVSSAHRIILLMSTMRRVPYSGKRGTRKVPPRESRSMRTGERSLRVRPPSVRPSDHFRAKKALPAVERLLSGPAENTNAALARCLLKAVEVAGRLFHLRPAAALLAERYTYDALPPTHPDRLTMLADLASPLGWAMFPRFFLDEHTRLTMGSLFRDGLRFETRLPHASEVLDVTRLKAKYEDIDRIQRLYAACHAKEAERTTSFAQYLVSMDVAWVGSSAACLAELSRLQREGQSGERHQKDRAARLTKWIFAHGRRDRETIRPLTWLDPTGLDYEISVALHPVETAAWCAHNGKSVDESGDILALDLLEAIPSKYRPTPVADGVEADDGYELDRAATRLRARVGAATFATAADAFSFAQTTLGSRITRWIPS